MREAEDLEAKEECLSSTFEKDGCAGGLIESAMGGEREWCRRGGTSSGGQP